MRNLHPTPTLRRARSLAKATILLTGLLSLGGAYAQSTAPGYAESAKDATTSRPLPAHDPFSPFVYDALGATPSIHFSTTRAQRAEQASSAQPAAKAPAQELAQGQSAARAEPAARR